MAIRTRTSRSALLITCALSVLVSACANQAEPTAANAWHFNGTQYAQTTSSAAYSPEGSSASGGANSTGNDASGDDWTKRTYVYRGGRDPRTGLAYNQM